MVSYAWLMYGEENIVRPTHDAGYPLPEEEKIDGGKELNTPETVDSQQSTQDKTEAVGSNSTDIAESQPVKPKYSMHPKCIVVGCSKLRAKGQYCKRHYKELQAVEGATSSIISDTTVLQQNIIEKNKAVKVLEMYEYTENGRKATIGIKGGTFSHIVLEGVRQSGWTFDDLMFMGGVAREIKRLVESSKA